jgi:LmbE family N-acetylglucosaminyl deacetylase
MPEKILVIMAHPDDAEIWAGGTLINHHKRGDQILLIYLYAKELNRRQEAQCVAGKLEAEIVFFEGNHMSSQLISLAKNFAPTIIITHWSNDTHYDHVRTFNAVWESIPELVITHQLRFTLYSCDCYNSVGITLDKHFIPTDFVDITNEWEQKMELISIYQSQPVNHWQKMIEIQNRLHGARSGVEYAEGYIQIPILGVIRNNSKFLKGDMK